MKREKKVLYICLIKFRLLSIFITRGLHTFKHVTNGIYSHRCDDDDDDSSEQWHLLLYFIKYVNYKRTHTESFLSLLYCCLFIHTISFSLTRSCSWIKWRKNQTNKQTKWHTVARLSGKPNIKHIIHLFTYISIIFK